jgi:hypothetical protein
MGACPLTSTGKNALAPQHFNMLVITANPPPGLISPMPAPQGDRTTALLNWAKGPGGCGVSMLRDLLEVLLNPPVGPSHSATPRPAGPLIPANVVSTHPGTTQEPLPAFEVLVAQNYFSQQEKVLRVCPHSFDEIAKDNFSASRQMLAGRASR